MSDELRSHEDAEVAAFFTHLRNEIAAHDPVAASRPDTLVGTPVGLARSESERYWAVTADRPFLYKAGAWGRIRGTILVPVKKALQKLMRWYVEPAFAQQRDFNAALLKTLDELSVRIDDMAASADATNASLEQVNRSLAGVQSSVTEIEERLLRVERRARRQAQPTAAEPQPEPVPVPADEPDYFAFESRMRGSSELIRERQSVYADEFREAAPVLDIGCGRGEFLAVLGEIGVEARGIDADPEMVAHCRDEGLAVEEADASGYLARLEDGSLGGIFCAHMLEHLEPRALFRVLEHAAAKLRPSGLFVAETPNPLSLVALANFSADLSHEQPLHPATLSFLARQAGFKEVSLLFMSEPPAEERLRLVPLPDEPALSRAKEALDANVNRLNEVVFGPQDYAVIARA
jgi:2-polyprenyl-3-methyl-5-hydroxy-6-metoxy-1,4-benzoquinol methylase